MGKNAAKRVSDAALATRESRDSGGDCIGFTVRYHIAQPGGREPVLEGPCGSVQFVAYRYLKPYGETLGGEGKVCIQDKKDS